MSIDLLALKAKLEVAEKLQERLSSLILLTSSGHLRDMLTECNIYILTDIMELKTTYTTEFKAMCWILFCSGRGVMPIKEIEEELIPEFEKILEELLKTMNTKF